MGMREALPARGSTMPKRPTKPPKQGPDGDLLLRIAVPFEYPVRFTRGAFDPANTLLLKTIDRLKEGRRHRAAVFLDAGLAEAQPGLVERVAAYFEKHRQRLELAAPVQLLPGGEAAKTGWEPVRRVMSLIGDLHLCRQSCVLAVGGGCVLDMVGFAASIVHRGLRLVRLPSTTLSQGDGGVGVKNGMDEHGMKNFVGTFAPPFAVINDLELLSSLPQREWIAGVAEAFKVAIIKDAGFFEFLCACAAALAAREESAMERTVRHTAALHVEHIGSGGDPFEFGSARPLDFGHWSAHRLESMSGYELGHGQAVAVGLALDSYYAMRRELISAEEFERILSGLSAAGLPVWDDLLARRDAAGRLEVLRGLEEFREHLGGALTVTLPRGIGAKVEVHEMDTALLEEGIGHLRKRAG
jgi:3-dehydroquinate synthase